MIDRDTNLNTTMFNKCYICANNHYKKNNDKRDKYYSFKDRTNVIFEKRNRQTYQKKEDTTK